MPKQDHKQGSKQYLGHGDVHSTAVQCTAAAQSPEPRTAKAALRQERRVARATLCAQLGPDGLRDSSLAAERTILTDPTWRAAHSVALYMALPGEPDCSLLIHMARLERRQVWLPRCLDRAGSMEFALYTGTQSLRTGFGGILEPDPALCPALASDLGPDLVIVPALAFDRAGYRLGYGGGYYDRQLACSAWKATRRLGMSFEAMLCEQLPHDSWDIPVHGLATEKGLIWL